jgi:DNA topoisomerase-1
VRAAPLRVLGAHPRDRQPVELHAGRYGPYVKHGAVNATVPDRDHVDTLTLEAAVELLDAKAGRTSTTRRTGATTRTRTAREPEVPAYLASAALNASRERGAATARTAAAKSKPVTARRTKPATTTAKSTGKAVKTAPRTTKPATKRGAKTAAKTARKASESGKTRK